MKTRRTWTNSFSLIIGTLRLGGQIIPTDTNTIRTFADNEIPPWLPILPQSIKSTKIDLDYFSLEWIYRDGINYLNPITNKYILYIHGGAFCFGSTGTHRDLLYRIAKKTGCVVLSVNYRKAPEHPYPTPLTDCLVTYMYLLGITKDSSKIYICGDSAGGNLSIYLMEQIIKYNSDKPAGLILISPWVDLEDCGVSPSWIHNSKYDIVNQRFANLFASEYIKNTNFSLYDVSPINIDGNIFQQFPPVLIEFGECEVLYDQIKNFCKKLKQSNCQIKANCRKDMIHVFPLFHFTGIAQSKDFFDSLNKFI
jgi:acetyl esterase/lipase